jgi:type I restriction enzyme, R subunit
MNQNPEQLARDTIDRLLHAAGWVVQPKKAINLAAATGVAVREYQTDIGPVDYVLFVDKKPVGIIEAKRTFYRSKTLLCKSETEISKFWWDI